MENIRERKRIENVTSLENSKKEKFKYNFRGLKNHETKGKDSVFAFKLYKRGMTSDKPIYLEFISLEIRKVHMYDFYSDLLQPYCVEDKLILRVMDTDSFIYSRTLKTCSIHSDLKGLQKNKIHPIFAT